MLIESVGHAGLRVTSGESTILIDPWFSTEGAFLGSWFQYPSNEHLLTNVLTRPDAIVISHEHRDHVDDSFLSLVAPDVPVYIPKYPSNVLPAKVLAGGQREIIELVEWQEREVAPGIRVFFVREESPMNHDSAMIIQTADAVLFDMNDARLSAGQIRNVRRQVGGNLDVLAIQGAGASWFPVCYRYDDERKRELSISKRRAKLTYAARAHEIAEPTITLPFAGPPVFLDDDLRFANAQMGPEGIFPDQQQVADWLSDQAGITATEVLLPGDSWDTRSKTIDRDGHWSGFSFNDRESYIAEYAKRRRGELTRVYARYQEPDKDLWDDFVAYFDHVIAMSPYFNRNIDMKVGFEVTGQGGGDWSVDFRAGSEGVAHGATDCQYVYRFASRWLLPILDGRVPWEDFFLSLRFEAWRDPDLYNDYLLGLLKFAWPDALDAVEQFETTEQEQETIDIHLDGKTYRIQRYCPHARQDLSDTAELLQGGVLRCLGHHYEFDLATGECLNGRCRPLQVTLIEDAAADTIPPLPGV